jgi:hypothetical protein
LKLVPKTSCAAAGIGVEISHYRKRGPPGTLEELGNWDFRRVSGSVVDLAEWTLSMR